MPVEKERGGRMNDEMDQNIETVGVTDTEFIVRLRLPCTLHQKNFTGPDGSIYQETILTKDQALILYEHLHRALFANLSP
jgi:hypothetical protein